MGSTVRTTFGALDSNSIATAGKMTIDILPSTYTLVVSLVFGITFTLKTFHCYELIFLLTELD